jgi:hypothetical protein
MTSNCWRGDTVDPFCHYAVQMLTPGSVNDDLTNFFHAGQISTSIAGAVAVDLTEAAVVAEERLTRARFDQAPVTNKGHVVGWIATDRLISNRSVKASMVRLENCTLVSAETSIAHILQLLLRERFLFTVGQAGLSGFIVHSDIDRHAVRSYLYLLISRIEMLLAEIVKSEIAEPQIERAIRRNMEDAYHEAREANQETSPAEYLYIGDLVELFNMTPYASDSSYWDSSASQLLQDIRVFRNSVMHPVRSIAAANNIEAAANMPDWTAKIAGRLHTIITSISKPGCHKSGNC